MAQTKGLRVGLGWDVHQLVEGRPLVLGGINIPHDRGLLGHSDADVLLHAIIDALLGATGSPDIGVLFPNTDPRWKDSDSIQLLRIVWEKLSDKGWNLLNIDACLLAEEPRLSPFIPQMKEKICAILRVEPESIGIKATTTETLGSIGRKEGIAAQAVALLERR